MNKPKRILYCHCAYAKVIPADVKQGVLEQLSASDAAFDCVADLCEMSAKKDPVLHQIANAGDVQIVACYPRAVKWLFSAAGAPLPDSDVHIHNMRTESADQIVAKLLDQNEVLPTQDQT
ncbi:MAG: hypothetical protein KDA87_21245 [Planctomycetales bacterium]|nr:hypothetical protein [Planctomycetales bacterium]